MRGAPRTGGIAGAPLQPQPPPSLALPSLNHLIWQSQLEALQSYQQQMLELDLRLRLGMCSRRGAASGRPEGSGTVVVSAAVPGAPAERPSG